MSSSSRPEPKSSGDVDSAGSDKQRLDAQSSKSSKVKPSSPSGTASATTTKRSPGASSSTKRRNEPKAGGVSESLPSTSSPPKKSKTHEVLGCELTESPAANRKLESVDDFDKEFNFVPSWMPSPSGEKHHLDEEYDRSNLEIKQVGLAFGYLEDDLPDPERVEGPSRIFKSPCRHKSGLKRGCRMERQEYTSEETERFEAEISKCTNLKELELDTLRYLVFKLEPDILSVAAGRIKSIRHRLFLAGSSEALKYACPIKAVTEQQMELINGMGQKRFFNERGFNMNYYHDVTLPEIIIRCHMAVHGTTFEESDRMTDYGLVNIYREYRNEMEKELKRLNAKKKNEEPSASAEKKTEDCDTGS